VGSPVDRLDGYELRHLVSDLVEVGALDQLHKLLGLIDDEGRNAWFEARNAHGDAAAYVANIRLAYEAPSTASASKASRNHLNELSIQVRYALMLASFNSLAANFLPGLLAALVAEGLWTSDQALTYATHGLEPGRQLETILTAIRDAAGERLAYLARQALVAVAQIQPDDTRGVRLGELAGQLPSAYLGDLIRIAEDITNQGSRAGALRALVPHLPEDLLDRASHLAVDLDDVSLRVGALAAVAARLSGQARIDGFRSVLALVQLDAPKDADRPNWSAQVLGDLARSVPPELISEVVATARRVLGEGREYVAVLTAGIARAADDQPLQVLESLKNGPDSAPQWDGLTAAALALARGGNGAKALEAARAIGEANSRARALGQLAAVISPANQDVLLRAIMALHEVYRGDPFEELAKHADEHLLPDLYSAALAFRDGAERLRAIAAVAARQPEGRRDQALAAAVEALQAAGSPRGLRHLAPMLSADQVRKALGVAQTSDPFERSDEIGPLLARLAELGFGQEALSTTSAIEQPGDRSAALALIAAHLSRELLPAACELAREIGDNYALAVGCAPLAAHLSDPVVTDLLNRAGQVRDREACIAALALLSGHVPKRHRRRALQGVLDRARQIDANHPEDVKACLQQMGSAARRPIPYNLWHQAMELAHSRLAPKEQIEVWTEFVRLHPRSGTPTTVWNLTIEGARIRTEQYNDEDFLVTLAPWVPPLALDFLVAAVSGITDEALRASVMAGVTPQLPRNRLSAVLANAMEMAGGVNRAIVLAVLARKLPPQARNHVVETELQRWKQDDLPESPEVFALVPLLKYGGKSAQEVYRRAVHSAEQLTDLNERAVRLMNLAIHAPAAMRLRVERSALRSLASVQASDRASMLEWFAPWISRRGLPEAIAIGSEIDQKGRFDLREALSALALRAARLGAERDVLAAIGAMTSPFDRDEAVKSIAPLLSVPTLLKMIALLDGRGLPDLAETLARKGAVKEAQALLPNMPVHERGGAIAAICDVAPRPAPVELLDEARNFPDLRSRSAALVALARRDDRSQADAIWLEAVAAAKSIDDPREQTEAFRAMAGALDKMPAGGACEVWHRTVASFQSRKRAEAFADLGTLGRPVLPAAFPQLASRLYEAATYVCDCWP